MSLCSRMSLSCQALLAPLNPGPLSQQLGTAQCPLQRGDGLISRSNGLSTGFDVPADSMGPSVKGRQAREFCRGSEQRPNPVGMGAAWGKAVPATLPDPSLRHCTSSSSWTSRGGEQTSCAKVNAFISTAGTSWCNLGEFDSSPISSVGA